MKISFFPKHVTTSKTVCEFHMCKWISVKLVNRNMNRVAIVLVLVFSSLLYMYQSGLNTRHGTEPVPSEGYINEKGSEDEMRLKSEHETIFKQRHNGMKTILYYTKLWRDRSFHFGIGNKPFHFANCKVTNCYATNNRSALGGVENFDAVLFHMREKYRKPTKFAIPKKRKENQRYIWHLNESPPADFYKYKRLPPRKLYQIKTILLPISTLWVLQIYSGFSKLKLQQKLFQIFSTGPWTTD